MRPAENHGRRASHRSDCRSCMSDRKEWEGERGTAAQHSQPDVTVGLRPDLHKKKRANVTPTHSFIFNLRLTSPVCRCNPSVIPPVPVIPFLL